MSVLANDTAFDALCEPARRDLDATDLCAEIKHLQLVDLADLQAMIAATSARCVDVREYDLEATIEHLDAAFKSLDAAQLQNGYVADGMCRVQRVYEGPRAPWLITLPSMLMLCAWGGVWDNTLQARAVIDDFGNLVAVEAWR